MQTFHHTACLFRRVGFWALIGVAVIFGMPPVLALISVLFSFALMVLTIIVPLALFGLLIGLFVRFFNLHSPTVWRGLRDTSKDICRKAVVAPLRTGGQVCHGAIHMGQHVRIKAHGFLAFVGGIFVEAFSGALVGTLLGAVVWYQSSQSRVPIAIGAGIGAVLGMLVGVSRLHWVRRSFADQPPNRVSASCEPFQDC
jgi:hypothetical protein